MRHRNTHLPPLARPALLASLLSETSSVGWLNHAGGGTRRTAPSDAPRAGAQARTLASNQARPPAGVSDRGECGEGGGDRDHLQRAAEDGRAWRLVPIPRTAARVGAPSAEPGPGHSRQNTCSPKFSLQSRGRHLAVQSSVPDGRGAAPFGRRGWRGPAAAGPVGPDRRIVFAVENCAHSRTAWRHEMERATAKESDGRGEEREGEKEQRERKRG